MNPYKFDVSFRLSHSTQSLKGLADKIETLPAFTLGRIWNVGDQRMSVKGEKLEGQYEHSYCFFKVLDHELDVEKKSMMDTIHTAIGALEGISGDLKEVTCSEGSAELFLAIYVDENSGETFSPDLLLRISKLNISLSLDIYPKG